SEVRCRGAGLRRGFPDVLRRERVGDGLLGELVFQLRVDSILEGRRLLEAALGVWIRRREEGVQLPDEGASGLDTRLARQGRDHLGLRRGRSPDEPWCRSVRLTRFVYLSRLVRGGGVARRRSRVWRASLCGRRSLLDAPGGLAGRREAR